MPVRYNYWSGKIICLILHKVWSALTQPLRCSCDSYLSSVLLPYLWYNETIDLYKHHILEDGCSSLILYESLTPFVRLIREGGTVASECSLQMEHAIRHMAYVFLLKIQDNLCNNTKYTLADDGILTFFPSASFIRSNPNSLPFVFWTPLSCYVRHPSINQVQVLPVRELWQQQVVYCQRKFARGCSMRAKIRKKVAQKPRLSTLHKLQERSS